MKNHTTIPPETTLAADEFATWIEKNGPKIQGHDHYEIHPCKRVRGFMLRLPGIGWRLWFPTLVEAGSFARRVAAVYAAECVVYDSSGEQVV